MNNSFRSAIKLARLFCAASIASFVSPTAMAAPGALDTTFNLTGFVTTDFGSNADGYAVAVQSDGKIVVAGIFAPANFDFAVARYIPNGTLDTTFNPNPPKPGTVTTDFGTIREYATSVTVQSDGKILVAGFYNPGLAIARYDQFGALDQGFGIGG